MCEMTKNVHFLQRKCAFFLRFYLHYYEKYTRMNIKVVESGDGWFKVVNLD